MVKNEVYEKEIEKIAPKLERLEGRPFDEIIGGLIHEITVSGISWDLIFALTYVLDPSRFYIEVGHDVRGYTVGFAADTPMGEDFGIFLYRLTRFDRRPTEKEARDFIKELLPRGRIEIEGLLKKAYGVVDTCKVIQGP